MSARLTEAPSVNVVAPFLSVPLSGIEVILTALNVFAGESFVSVREKSEAAKIFEPSSPIVIELFAPVGASLTLLIVSVKGELLVASGVPE